MRIRRLFAWSHRWFGLVAGFHFVLLGLSGSWLVYEDEIESLLKPHFRNATSAQVSLAPAIAKAKEALSLERDPVSVKIPEGAKTIAITFDVTEPEGARRLATAYVDPATSDFRGSEVYRETLSGFIFLFHHDLFWGRTGRTLMAVSGLFMVALLVSGVYLWWPRSWRLLLKSLTLRNSLNRRKFYLDLHKVVGIYTLVLMIVVTATGVVISRPDWFRRAGEPAREGGGPPEASATAPIDFARIESEIAKLGALRRPLSLRIDGRKQQLTATQNETRYTIDLQSFVAKPQETRAPDFRAVNHDLHVGDFWGELGRALIFLSGLLPLFFYVTGFYVWIRSRPSP